MFKPSKEFLKLYPMYSPMYRPIHRKSKNSRRNSQRKSRRSKPRKSRNSRRKSRRSKSRRSKSRKFGSPKFEMPYKTITTFQELLKFGCYILDHPEIGENVSGLEDHTIESITSFSELKELNKYMFTTYSTNSRDIVYSLSGIIPLSKFNKIKKDLDCYLYMVIDPISGKVIENHLIDPKDYDADVGDSVNFFNLGWSGEEPLHTYVDSKLGDTVGDEVLEYIDASHFKGNNELVVLSIQDPIVGRISLYRKLTEFLKKY